MSSSRKSPRPDFGDLREQLAAGTFRSVAEIARHYGLPHRTAHGRLTEIGPHHGLWAEADWRGWLAYGASIRPKPARRPRTGNKGAVPRVAPMVSPRRSASGITSGRLSRR